LHSLANPLTNESSGTKITKRPLLHPPIAPPRSGASVQKIVYISASSPFISTTKRVRKYLGEIDKRALGKIDLLRSGMDRTKIQDAGRGGVERAKEEVLVKATGKAIEKGLRVALFFQGQEDCLVRLRTGSVGAVDDVLVREGVVEGDGGGEDVPETRVRRTSMLEVGISLR
jgi:ribonuclease P/MRP protein subunit POP7